MPVNAGLLIGALRSILVSSSPILDSKSATSSDTSLYTLNYSAADGKQITIVPKTNDGKTVKGIIANDGKVTWEEVSE